MNTHLINLIKQLPFFSSLSEAQLEELSLKGSPLETKKDTCLFEVGDQSHHVFLTLSGSVKLAKSNSEGKERILFFGLKGDLLGGAVALQGTHYPVAATTIENSLFLKITANNFKNYFLTHPVLGKTLFEQVTRRLKKSHNDRLAVFSSVEERLALFVSDLWHQAQEVYGEQPLIPIPLTHQNIANRIGSTVETVIRISNKWREKGLIEFSHHQITIKDKAYFKKAPSH